MVKKGFPALPADFPVVLVARVLAIASLAFSCLIAFEFWFDFYHGPYFEPYFIPVEVFGDVSALPIVLIGAAPPALILASTVVSNSKAAAVLVAVSLAVPVLLGIAGWDYGLAIPGSGSSLFDLLAFASIGGCALLSATTEKDLSVVVLLASAVLVIASVVVFLLSVAPFYGRYTSALLSASLNWLAVSLLVSRLLSVLVFKMGGEASAPRALVAPFALEKPAKKEASACGDLARSGMGVASIAEELKGFKELLDMGAITQEEYDMKKKELLGL